MKEVRLKMLNLSVDMINFDPDVLNVGVSFLATAGKYAFFFGIFGYLIKMLTRAGTGKERFL